MLGRAIKASFDAFVITCYADEVDRRVQPLELKDRIGVMSDALRVRLPEDYKAAAAIISASLGPPLEGETGMFTTGYWLTPFARLIEDHGTGDLETSLDLCEATTQRNSAEYAIRPYLELYPNEALTRIHTWVDHPKSHVRRLASEGVRHRLPWARRLPRAGDDDFRLGRDHGSLSCRSSKLARSHTAKAESTQHKAKRDCLCAEA